MSKRSLACVLALVFLVVASLPLEPVQAKKPAARNFITQMNGEEEVPPRETDAHGVAAFHLSPDESELRFLVVVNGILNVVAAHIHSGPPGVNGPIILGLFDAAPAGGPENGLLVDGTVLRGVTPLPPSLGAGLNNAQRFDALIELMRSGNTYVNVHTNDGVAPINTGPGDFPGGEIRGQLDPKPDTD